MSTKTMSIKTMSTPIDENAVNQTTVNQAAMDKTAIDNTANAVAENSVVADNRADNAVTKTPSKPSSNKQAISPPTAKTKKSSPKKRQKSLADKQAAQFLKNQFALSKKKLYLSFLLDVVSAVLLCVQMAFLASVVASVLYGQLGGQIKGQWLNAQLQTATPWVSVLVIASCLIIRPVLLFWRDKWLFECGSDVAQNVKDKGLYVLGELGLARKQFGADGALASHIINEPEALIGYGRFFVQKMTAVTVPVIIACAVATKSLTAAVILLATAPLVPIFMALIGIKTAKKSREQMDALAQLGGRFLDWLRGMNTLVRLSAVSIAGQDVKQASENYKIRTMSVLKIAFLNSAVLEFLSALSIALVAVYLGFGLMGLLPWHTGQMLTSYENALFILLLVPEFYAPLRRLGAEYHIKGNAEAAAKALAPLTELDHHPKPAPNLDGFGDNKVGKSKAIVLKGVFVKNDHLTKVATNANLSASDLSANDLVDNNLSANNLPANNLVDDNLTENNLAANNLTENNLTDSHPTNIDLTNNRLLDNSQTAIHKTKTINSIETMRLPPISLDVPFGAKIAIQGVSGSGKSTLFQVLLGFSAYGGSAKIADNEIAAVNMADIRPYIGYLPQTPALLPISIADNLRLSCPNACDDDLYRVLAQVELLALIQALPDGLDTVLTERGGGLSGGQAQRLAIAQLLLQNADIWLLDEPTEHLDEQTKTAIHALLHRLSTSKTLLWATHDSPVDWLDEVLDLDKLVFDQVDTNSPVATDKHRVLKSNTALNSSALSGSAMDKENR